MNRIPLPLHPRGPQGGALDPFPTGWYGLCFSSELQTGAVLHGRYVGQELVIFRTHAGRAVAMDAYCPHMGAHLGHGGTVQGETLRCPFHGFCFDARGECVSTPYGKRLPRASACVLPVVERNGCVLAWHDRAGRAPLWEIPELDPGGYGRLVTKIYPRLRSHPQETSENSVDLGHLGVVHGYEDVAMLGALETDGPHLFARYTMRRKNPFVPWLEPVKADFDVHVHGLGYSFVQVVVPAHGLWTRHFVLSTPLDGEHIALRIAVQVKLPEPARISRALGLVPGVLARELVGELTLRAYAHDVSQDFAIWENKRYVQPPALAEGDGPVGRYRSWCRQFYPSDGSHCATADEPPT
jgi:nitrite reductase/ring-hydroxylating ferredoxin subunit